LLLAASCGLGCADSDRLEPDASAPDASSQLDIASEQDAAAADGGKEQLEAYTEALAVGEWDELDLAARRKFMKEMVVPAMRQAFAEFDAVRFPGIGCKSCHGSSGVADGSFAMPSPELPVLDGAALMNPKEGDKAILEFMRMVVKPKLSELLGVAPGSMQGIRCGTCHTMPP
jgi:hypothetical protein